MRGEKDTRPPAIRLVHYQSAPSSYNCQAGDQHQPAPLVSNASLSGASPLFGEASARSESYTSDEKGEGNE